MIYIPGLRIRAVLHDGNGAVHNLKLEILQIAKMKPITVISLLSYRMCPEDVLTEAYLTVRHYLSIKFANQASEPENVDTREKLDMDKNL